MPNSLSSGPAAASAALGTECSAISSTTTLDRVPGDRSTIAMVGAASAVHGTGLLPQLLAGGPVGLVPAPATLPLGELVDRLNRLQAPRLYVYPSILALLAREQHAGRLAINPVSINTHSETLLPEHRAAVAAAFHAPICNLFGSSEGLFGASGPNETTLTFAGDLSCAPAAKRGASAAAADASVVMVASSAAVPLRPTRGRLLPMGHLSW